MACKSGSRRSAKLLEDAEKASHFVVQWTEGTDQGMLSIVPRTSLVSNPPFSVGFTVLVKYAGKRGAIEKDSARVMSKGSKDAMEKAIARMTQLTQPIDKPDPLPGETSNSSKEGGLTVGSSQVSRSKQKRKQCDDKNQMVGKCKRKKPSMTTDSAEEIDNSFDSQECRSISKASDVCKQPFPTEETEFLNTYKQLRTEISAAVQTSTPLKIVDTRKGITGSVLEELQDIKDKLKCLDDLVTIKDSIAQLKEKLDTLVSQKACVQSAQMGCSSNLLPESESVQFPEVYNGVTLTEFPCTPNSPQKYARKVMTQLFSKEEMAAGLFGKVGPSTRPLLSPTRSETIMRCLKKKYTASCISKCMPQIRESLNQKCRDLRKKFGKNPVEPAVYAISSKSFCVSDDDEEK